MAIALSLGTSALASDRASTLADTYKLETEFSSIVKSDDGDYAMISESKATPIPVGRIDVLLDDENAIREVLEMDNVSEEVKEYLLTLSEKALNEPENAGLVATLFSQDLLPKTRATVYHTYNGMSMKSDQVYVYNISSGFQFKKTGTTALTTAKVVYEVGLYAAGVFSNAVALGGTLISIFEAAAGGNVYSASASDFTQIEIKYDGVSQWTYGQIGNDWYLGYCSQKVTVNQITMYQQFVVNGVGTQKYSYKYPYTTVKSANFDSPWSTAYSWLYNPIADWVSYKINGTTWYFG